MITNQVSATTTRAKIIDVVSGFGHQDRERSFVVKHTTAGSTVYIGGLDVTTANGWPMGADDPMEFVVEANEELWAVTASGTVTVYVMGVG